MKSPKSIEKVSKLPKVSKLAPPGINGRVAAALTKLAKKTAATKSADARAAAIANAPPAPKLELPPIKALPAPVKPPTVEHPKDVTYVSVRRDVLKACLLATAKKDSRAALEGVYVHLGVDGSLRCVATNGQTLLLHSTPPAIDGVAPVAWLSAGVILPREGLQLAVSAIDKLDGGDAATVQIGYAPGHGYAIVKDAHELATFRLRRIDAAFPAYDKVVDQAAQVLAGGERAPLTSTSFDGAYVKQAAAVGAVFDAKGLTPFVGADPKAPVVITFFGEAGALFIICPLVSSSSEQLPTQTMAIMGRALEGTLAALKASQTRQKKLLAETKNEGERKQLTAAIALRDERIANVVTAIKGKLLTAPKAA